MRGVVEGIAESGAVATVVLFPQSVTGAGYSVRTDAQGNFQIGNLPPGGYYAVALDQFDSRTMTDKRSLTALVPQASSVKVEESGSASIQLRLTQLPR